MSNDTGYLRPDKELNDVFRAVARDLLDDEHGAVKSGTNAALLDFLENAPDDVLDYHLDREGYETLDDLRDGVRDRQSTPFPDMADRGQVTVHFDGREMSVTNEAGDEVIEPLDIGENQSLTLTVPTPFEVTPDRPDSTPPLLLTGIEADHDE